MAISRPRVRDWNEMTSALGSSDAATSRYTFQSSKSFCFTGPPPKPGHFYPGEGSIATPRTELLLCHVRVSIVPAFPSTAEQLVVGGANDVCGPPGTASPGLHAASLGFGAVVGVVFALALVG